MRLMLYVMCYRVHIFFFKQKTAYEMRISDWSSDVCSSDLFCMYIRRAMLEDVGLFDEQAFPVGYGEENDLCMRAIDAGWHHLVDPGVFVQHARSASFGSRREELAKVGAQQLESRHPT